jgi:hypothetical protein
MGEREQSRKEQPPHLSGGRTAKGRRRRGEGAAEAKQEGCSRAAQDKEQGSTRAAQDKEGEEGRRARKQQQASRNLFLRKSLC